ncbi:hypothetical protein J5N97_015026 [Dioscorea zingiberensis]|uniref:Poly(A) RNA polymerase mitochondrial-like central palm domain-containing protein n=1 Tax=Dioscorea zingiberensis TaxID=325984 RepID=A0A9D5CV13_9LILI|nr:hypothetical protein J5N97_015026 [Dioscorea zingiberensis]
MDYYHSSSSFNDPHRVLERCLKDILNLIKPLETDRMQRLNVIEELESILRSQTDLKGALVKPFGSFVSNLYSKTGDLDISVDFSDSSHISASTPRLRKQDFLRNITRAILTAGFGRNHELIATARVPILKFQSNYQNISCDISIDNHTGQIKSKILLWISDIDKRFQDMVLLIKEWAKAQNINDPKHGTLNSYSLCLLVIFHFQTCSPPILPPLKDIYNRNIADAVTGMTAVTERRIEDICLANIASFKSQISRSKNQSSLSQLLIAFFDKFSSIGPISSEYVISTYTGQMENRRGNRAWLLKSRAVSYNYRAMLLKSRALFIEDPFERPDNAARAVGWLELSKISRAFREAHRKFSSEAVCSDRASVLANLVKPHICSQLAEAIDTVDEDEAIDTDDEPIEAYFQNALRLDRSHSNTSALRLDTDDETIEAYFQNRSRSNTSTFSSKDKGRMWTGDTDDEDEAIDTDDEAIEAYFQNSSRSNTSTFSSKDKGRMWTGDTDDEDEAIDPDDEDDEDDEGEAIDTDDEDDEVIDPDDEDDEDEAIDTDDEDGEDEAIDTDNEDEAIDTDDEAIEAYFQNALRLDRSHSNTSTLRLDTDDETIEAYFQNRSRSNTSTFSSKDKGRM